MCHFIDDDPASQIFQHYSNRISQVSLTDSCIQLLYTEGLITEDTQRKIEKCGGSLSDTLRELMIAVSDDHRKLRSLGNILMKLEKTEPLAQDIIKDCGKSRYYISCYYYYCFKFFNRSILLLFTLTYCTALVSIFIYFQMNCFLNLMMHQLLLVHLYLHQLLIMMLLYQYRHVMINNNNYYFKYLYRYYGHT